LDSQQHVINVTRTWLRTVVIDLNLCPFAHTEYKRNSIRYTVSKAASNEQLLQDLVIELALLKKEPSIETTLLIHPQRLTEFDEYVEFLDFATQLMRNMGFEGDYQLASFHPDYCFADSQADDAANYTNRSPYPMLHILRESSVEKAIAKHANVEGIPDTNIKRLNELGAEHMATLLNSCFQKTTT